METTINKHYRRWMKSHLGSLTKFPRANWEDVKEAFSVGFKQGGVLNKRELLVLFLYFGMDGKPWTHNEIANLLGLSQERIRQIKVKAIRKIKGSVR